MWDKLEVTYEGTTKVKEIRIGVLIIEYELFKIVDHEVVEYVFS